MRAIAVVVLAGLCAGCVTQGQGPTTAKTSTPTTLTAADTKAIHEGIRKALKDPDSARYGTMTASVNEKGSVTVCGFVNAKNSFGGYTGEKPFVGILSRNLGLFSIIGMGGGESDDFAVRHVCRGAGLTV